MIIEHLSIALGTFVIALLLHWLMFSRDFFTPLERRLHPNRISLRHLVFVLFIFFAIYLFFPPIVFVLLSKVISISKFTLSSIAQIICLILFLALYNLFLHKDDYIKIRYVLKWSDEPISSDIYTGLICWLISFPLVTTMSELAQAFNLMAFGDIGPEQTVIQSLREMTSHPFACVVLVLLALVVAPILEEYLFRGLFYNFLRSKMGIVSSLCITSLGFSFMHFNLSQGIGNIPLIASLFVLSLYLGYAYEKSRSLLAPITLHFTFNLISVIRILVF